MILHHCVKALQALPKQVVLFTVLDLPPSQLSFLRRLGQYMDVLILHFNPSQEYWADTVDANWKKQYDVKLKQRFQEKNPEATTAQIDAFFEKYTLEYGQQRFQTSTVDSFWQASPRSLFIAGQFGCR